MAAPAPDDEAWRRMSPFAKRIYWGLVSIVVGVIFLLLFKSLFQ